MKYNVRIQFDAEIEFEFDPTNADELEEEQIAELKDLTPDELKDWLLAEIESDPERFGEITIDDSPRELTLTPLKQK